MTTRVPVETPGRDTAYEILVGPAALDALPALLAGRFGGRRVAVIADAGALGFHRERLASVLPAKTPVLEVPSGEETKTRAEKERLEDELASLRLGRDTVILGFGGGVATDLAGFVAATWLRGVPFVAAPTTLLAAVDASVGGKVGVNTGHGKNRIGVIRQPAAVLAETALLATLPEAELRNGLAEALKMAATSDRAFFAEIEGSVEKLLAGEDAALTRLIAASVRIKAAVVRADEHEAGLREVLNFGHTVGHGLERASGYRLPHGAAVAIGMIAESRMAREAGFLAATAEARLEAAVASLGLPRRAGGGMDRAAVVRAMASDKKARGGEPRFVVLRAIGSARQESDGGRAVVSFPLPSPVVASGLARIGL